MNIKTKSNVLEFISHSWNKELNSSHWIDDEMIDMLNKFVTNYNKMQ